MPNRSKPGRATSGAAEIVVDHFNLAEPLASSDALTHNLKVGNTSSMFGLRSLSLSQNEMAMIRKLNLT